MALFSMVTLYIVVDGCWWTDANCRSGRLYIPLAGDQAVNCIVLHVPGKVDGDLTFRGCSR